MHEAPSETGSAIDTDAFGTFGLTSGEREAEDLFASNETPEELLHKIVPRAIHAADGTFTVTCRGMDQPAIELTIDDLVATPGLRSPLADAIARRARHIEHASLVTELSSVRKFVTFLETRNMLGIKPRHITDQLLDDYVGWLNEFRTPTQEDRKTTRQLPKGAFPLEQGRRLTSATKKAYVDQLLVLLRLVRLSKTVPFELRRDLDLVRGQDWSRRGTRRRPTQILTRPQLKSLVRICRREVDEITRRLNAAWAVSEHDRGEQAGMTDPGLVLEVAHLREFTAAIPPSRKRLRGLLGSDSAMFPRLLGLDGDDYEKAIALRYPTARLLMPFIFLFAIYYRFNPTQLYRLKRSDFSEQPSPNGSRLVGQKFKNRAGKWQVASWPVTADLHNPSVMIDTLERWTSLLRPHAPEGSENRLFLARMSYGRLIVVGDGKSDRQRSLQFMRENQAKVGSAFTLKTIRPSVINLVHHLFDGDLLATAEAGQHQVQTMVDHYLSDGARKLNDEALVPAVHMMNGWVGSNGQVDAREDKRGGDRSAATPGFRCRDRYGSTMPGQRQQTLCTAYGMCGSCDLKELELTSPSAFALIRKLRDALIRSRPRMPAESWLARWSGILDELDAIVTWQFPPHVRDAADLNIPDLPTVE